MGLVRRYFTCGLSTSWSEVCSSAVSEAANVNCVEVQGVNKDPSPTSEAGRRHAHCFVLPHGFDFIRAAQF